MIILIEVLCLLFASFFAGMETGLLSADRIKIFGKKEGGNSWAKSADFLLKKPERLLGTTLIGTNIAVVTSSIILNNYLRNNYSGTAAVIGSSLLIIIYLLFSEIIPKTFFRRYADSVTVRLSLVLRFFFYIFLPISFIVNSMAGFLMLLLRQKNIVERMPRSRDDFRMLMHLSSKESGFVYDDYRAIDDILDFSETLASEAMIPLHKYPVFHINTNPLEVIRVAGQMNQRYFPCFSKRTDDIIGYIDVQDFCCKDNYIIKQIMRPPEFYPEVKPLPDLLGVMVERALEIVFLTDEYGGISGIITHQQIASEIIGAIPGNYLTIKDDVIKLDSRVFVAAGNTDLEYFSHVTEIKIKKGNNETLGGYLCERLGIIPQIGKVFREGNIKYTVLDGDRLAISRVRIEILNEDDDE